MVHLTEREPFPDGCAHQLFEQQVLRDPDAIAVAYRDQRLTYGELNARANQIAHFLRQKGVGPDVLVGVSLERSPSLVAALLGVWKAGGAWVPLDPAYPEDRLAFMVGDAGLRILLTESKCRPLFRTGIPVLVCLDTDWAQLAGESTENPTPSATASDLAYVMYTSGSTGQPKGAMILHRGLVNYLWWAIKAYGVTRDGAVPVHTSISFDLTVTSLFPALLAGAQVELLPEDVAAQNLIAALRRRRNFSLVKITPAHLDLLREQFRPEEAAALTQTFVIGGENLVAETLELWRDYAPETRLINEYGPTETVVGCCTYEVRPEDPRTGSVPIGRPIANTQLHILGPDLKPVADGESGELYIGGAGVARGYFNRAELTRERFIDDPFTAGERLYKSGDLARRREDGLLEYLGRLDNQVKVRGYRIELGEIEATLAGHPRVHTCAVLARESPGGKQLVGYVVAQPGPRPAIDDLQRFVGERLPEYMVPPQFVFLDALPLTHNGKVDRKALPEPVAEVTPQSAGAAPRNETERVIAEIWASVLGVSNVGVDQDFFDLGGHSLLAIQALAKMRDALGVELAPQVLFEHSTVAALAALVKGPASEAPSHAAPARKPGGSSEVSFGERQLWVLNQLAPDSPAYNICDRVLFTGPYDAKAMQRAVDGLVRRHEALRTAFVSVDGVLTRRVVPARSIEVPEFDLAGLPPEQRAREWTRIASEHARKLFDLSKPPLVRFAVVHLSPIEHRVLVSVHHVVGDEWSIELVHRELKALYAGAALAELPVQAGDFAAWQNASLTAEVLGQELAHWKAELSGAPTTLSLPTDKLRPTARSFAGATHRFRVPKALLDRLVALGRKEHATLFMVLEAAFAALLHRITGQTDLLIGTPISLRTHTETQGLIGCFLNTVVLRAQLEDGPSFEALLRQTRDRALAAYAHALLPFTQLVDGLALERDPGQTPLVQVMFILHSKEGESQLSSAGSPELETGTSKFDLTLYTAETDDGLEAQLEYSTELFDAVTMRRLGADYARLLEALVEHPAEKISALATLDAADRQRLLVDWNATAVTAPGSELTLPRLLEGRAAAHLDRVAVVCGDDRITHGALEARANQLAHHLRGLGVGPDVLVGLFVERSIDMVVGLLGILKAGGAYVPLDPAFPADRLQYMVENSQMRVVVTHRALLDTLRVRPAQVVHLKDDAAALARQPAQAPAVPDLGLQHLAYVLYTSGSTGLPKGVAIPHQAIVNLLLSTEKEPGLTAADTLLAVTTLSFDIAALELFLPLLTGATLAIASRDEALDSALLMQRMRSSGCTVLQATPATWHALIAAGWKGTPGLRALCGGEALAPDLAHALLSRCSELWNMYGPTETTVWSTLERVAPAGQICIGRPMANTQVYVLDANRNLVAPGLIGELYIGGAGLARGYLHRDELTREKFVANPFNAGTRLYRTGDLARWRHDGRLECLGRTDHQVKIRGYRIELGEIEACLAKHPAVTRAVVLAREDTPGDKRLVAYVVAPQASDDLFDQLRAELKGALPRYMMPAQFVALPALPLTPNGKIDRKALPAPVADDAAAGELVAPRNETERTIAGVWATVLGLPSVGVTQDFFDLGGHSLLAIQALSKLRDLLKTDLPPQILFEHSTVAELAAWVLERPKGPSRPAPTRRAGGSTQVSFAEQQLWVLNQLTPDSPAYNIGDAIVFTGAWDTARMKRALEALTERHEVLRTTYSYEDETPIRTVQRAPAVEFSELDLGQLPPEAREERWKRAAREHTRKVFDLSRAPLARFEVVHLSPTEHRLLVSVHHIVADEWSMEIIQRELKSLYEGKPLAELPVQYGDFAAWQRGWLNGDVQRQELEHWKLELQGAPTVLALAPDRPRPASRTFAGATHRFLVARPLLEQLQALGRTEQATLFMVLEAAFSALLHRATGQNDVLVGTPISLRTHTELQGLVGCFLNTIVLRSQADGDPSFEGLLRQTRDRALRAYAHAELPFKQLVDAMAHERDPGQLPLVQVMFVLNAGDGAARAAMTAGSPELETGTSKFDLTLYTAESEAGLEGQLEYSTELFEPATAQRLCAEFQALLEAIVLDPAKRLSALSTLGADDRQRLLTDWNATATRFPEGGLTLPRLLERRAAKHLDRLAVVFADQQATHRELEVRSNQLAHHLRALGVGPDVLVGLFVERSIDMVVGLLGILKAGGAYVPLDPAFPVDRLDHMVADSRMKVVVTHRDLVETLKVRPAQVVHLSRDAGALAAQPGQPPEVPGLKAEHLAYVLYTSGSTGLPKGVAIPHAAIVNLLLSMEKTPGLTAADTLLAVTTLSFDIAGLELFLPLLAGAKLVIASRDEAVDPALLMGLLRGCTVMQATPATWRSLIAEGWKGTAGLRVLCGGEALARDLAAALLERCSELWNVYGPTETTVWSTVERITSAEEQICIGRPIANTQAYVLGEGLSLVAPGRIGELFLGGDGLARGYLNRDALTAEKFVANPFKSGTRLYRTGDLARWRLDGRLECLGRTDHQVKIRGFRIELGEIEACIAKHSAVTANVVVAREDSPGDKRLVAYVVAPNAPPELFDALRTQLRAAVPRYMVPAQFVALPALPLTPNGKVDRKALPRPVAEASAHEEAGPAGSNEPLTEMEKAIAAVWRELLKVPSPKRSDNFFDLGGESLIAVQMSRRLRAKFGLEMPLAALLESPTLQACATLLDGLRGVAPRPAQREFEYLVTIRPGDADRLPFFCVAGAGGNVLNLRDLALRLDARQPFIGIQAHGVDGRDPHGSVEQAAEAYLGELRLRQPHGPYLLGGYSGGGTIAYEMAMRLSEAGETIALLAMFDTWSPLMVRKPPTLQTRLARLRDDGLAYLPRLIKRRRFRREERRVHASLRQMMDENRPIPAELRELYLFFKLGEAIDRYKPRPWNGKATLFRATTNYAFSGGGWALEWDQLMPGRVEVIQVPGDHVDLLLEPHVSELAGKLSQVLARAQPSR